jgi:TPR repeat protein
MEKAADAGHLLAMNDLGDMYYSGDGVPQEYERAFAWYRKGAMAGNVLAMANLAYLYEHGWGVAKDRVQACAWYRKAAGAGEQNSIRNLRLLDPNGEAIAQDETQTREWYQKRALAGDVAAMYKLGGMYADGRGVSQDYAKAADRLPGFVEPMKAKLVGSMRPGDWIYEIKFDGYRALALRGGSEARVLSRNAGTSLCSFRKRRFHRLGHPSFSDHLMAH